MMQWTKATFVIDSLPSVAFDGYSNGNMWNGWACPFFDRETAEHVLRASESNDYLWEYDPVSDAFVVHSAGDPADYEPEVFSATKARVGDTELTLYGIGAYSWIWEEAEPVN